MNALEYALLSVAGVSALSLVGLAGMSIGAEKLRRFMFILVSFAVGALFGDVFLHLIPEAMESPGAAQWLPYAILSGFFLFFGLEKFVRWRHCHLPEGGEHHHPLVTMNLVGDGLHNLLDGAVIMAAYTVDPGVGLATTLAVFFHELPQEIGDFGILLSSGMSVKKAILFNVGSGLLAFVGVGLSWAAQENFSSYSYLLTGVTAGGFLYVAAADLVPELHHEVRARVSALQGLCILLGFGVMALLANI